MADWDGRHWFGGQDRPLTDDERTFLGAVRPANVDELGLAVWRHSDDLGLWLLVSYDLVVDGRIREVLRVDFDGESICGGFSPQFLNGDDGVRAGRAGVRIDGREGLPLTPGEPSELGQVVTTWFERKIDAFIRRTGR